jgi:hypothetical protein
MPAVAAPGNGFVARGHMWFLTPGALVGFRTMDRYIRLAFLAAFLFDFPVHPFGRNCREADWKSFLML